MATRRTSRKSTSKKRTSKRPARPKGFAAAIGHLNAAYFAIGRTGIDNARVEKAEEAIDEAIAQLRKRR